MKKFIINYTNGQKIIIEATELDENTDFFIFYDEKKLKAMINKEFVFELLIEEI